ncbi:MAG: hypothetical protein A3F78_07530 [Burkholderiales bacterium RIFCSPLOWO2_12_FULL_61_40]|nr:MAG: hypothetical protein A3F78_07530 [Burkholderiales bacterium RIFCSPLOWO2_12_FULL_61_40]
MKPRSKKARKQERLALQGAGLGEDFVRGFVSTALLAGLKEHQPSRLLRVALQGGIALAAASAAARATTRRSIPSALGAALVGYASMQLVEQIAPVLPASDANASNPSNMKEQEHGQET